jgi:lysylphosphatidylglycerol synthetase-like protein (DUF2156 family)
MSTALQAPARETPFPDLTECINHPSGYFALSPRKDRFTVSEIPGLIAYKEYGKHLVMMGGVHAPVPHRAQLLDSFLAEAGKRKRRVIVLQLNEEQLPLFASRGFTVNQFGSSFALRLSGFTFAGTKRMKLRHKIKRAHEAGLRVVEIGRELPDNESTYQQIYGISDNWLKEKGRKELDFLIGEIGHSGQTQRRIFAVVDAQERMLGFITYVPVWGEHPGMLHDLTRRLPDAPPGIMELCNAFAIRRFTEENVTYLHFGFTPFIVDDRRRPGENRILATIVRLIGKYGSANNPALDQVRYKQKWAPDIVEREYIAYNRLSLRALIDVLRVTQIL